MSMKPTPHLRFVERTVYEKMPPGYYVDVGEILEAKKRMILQQWWAADPDSETDFMLKVNGEWFDVPLEKEA